MKKLMFALSSLALVLGPSVSWSADQSATQPTSGASNPSSNSSSNSNSMGASSQPAAQTAPENWTNLSGIVQSVDMASKTLQIKDSSGNLVQVPVDQRVSIQKDGKQVELSQIQSGDTVVLAKATPSTQPNTY